MRALQSRISLSALPHTLRPWYFDYKEDRRLGTLVDPWGLQLSRVLVLRLAILAAPRAQFEHWLGLTPLEEQPLHKRLESTSVTSVCHRQVYVFSMWPRPRRGSASEGLCCYFRLSPYQGNGHFLVWLSLAYTCVVTFRSVSALADLPRITASWRHYQSYAEMWGPQNALRERKSLRWRTELPQ